MRSISGGLELFLPRALVEARPLERGERPDSDEPGPEEVDDLEAVLRGIDAPARPSEAGHVDEAVLHSRRLEPEALLAHVGGCVSLAADLERAVVGALHADGQPADAQQREPSQLVVGVPFHVADGSEHRYRLHLHEAVPHREGHLLEPGVADLERGAAYGEAQPDERAAGDSPLLRKMRMERERHGVHGQGGVQPAPAGDSQKRIEHP